MIADQRHGILNSGNNFGRRCFQLSNVPSVLVGSALSDLMAITRITVPKGLSEPATPGRSERSFTIGVHLRRQPETERWGTWVDGKFVPIRRCDRGAVGIYDLEAYPIAVRPTGFDSVHFNLPRRTLDAFADDNEMNRICDFTCIAGTRDDVLLQLASFALPWLGDERRVHSLMFDYFVWMFCSHVVSTYGQAQRKKAVHTGGMAPWQKRRFMELIDANLDGELRLSHLAKECGLSVSHFCRSFKRSFGMSPHQWLIRHRIGRAKALMTASRTSLMEIAIQSGFNDQAAFTNAFRQLVGVAPGRWRRDFASSDQALRSTFSQ